MRRFLLALLLINLFQQPAAAQAAPAPKVPLATRVQVRGAECALFPARAVSYYNVQATFMPTSAQAAEAEKALATPQLSTIDPHAKNWYKKQPDPAYTAISPHLPLYRQQFYGFLNAKRQPCLFINAFPLDKNFITGQRWYAKRSGCTMVALPFGRLNTIWLRTNASISATTAWAN